MTLWRADASEEPWFGFGSFWASSRGHAESYRARPGFGGPQLYRTTVTTGNVLDLRTDPWAVLAERGLDRDDYPEAAPDHELFWELSTVLAAWGYEWVVFTVGDGLNSDEEWIYLGREPIGAVLAARDALTAGR